MKEITDPVFVWTPEIAETVMQILSRGYRPLDAAADGGAALHDRMYVRGLWLVPRFGNASLEVVADYIAFHLLTLGRDSAATAETMQRLHSEKEQA
jgi:hypothetical protein